MPNFTPPSFAMRAARPERRAFSSSSPVGVDGSSAATACETPRVYEGEEGMGGGLCVTRVVTDRSAQVSIGAVSRKRRHTRR